MDGVAVFTTVWHMCHDCVDILLAMLCHACVDTFGHIVPCLC